MSRVKWQLPDRNGAELWPSATRIPPKVVFEGVPPGSVQAQQLFEMLQGPINRFYLKAAQDHNNSGRGFSGYHQSIPGLAMRYSANHGQETLRIKVSKGLAAKAVKDNKSTNPWDWILLDYHVPISGSDAGLAMRALRTIPASREQGITNEGFVYDPIDAPDNVDGLDPPVLRYPGTVASHASDSSVPEVMSSLAIDLRRFRPGPVTVEVGGAIGPAYGQEIFRWAVSDWVTVEGPVEVQIGTFIVTFGVAPDVEFDPHPLTIWEHAQSAQVPVLPDVRWQSGLFAVEDIPFSPPPLAAAPDNYLYTEFNPAYSASEVPGPRGHTSEVTYHAETGLPETYLSEVVSSHKVSGSSANVGPGTIWTYRVTVTTRRERRYFSPDYQPVPVPTGAVGAMRFIAGWGAPPWEPIDITGPDDTDYLRWGLVDTGEVQLLPTTLLNDNVPISGPPDAEEPYPLLGTLVVFPEQHAAVFTTP